MERPKANMQQPFNLRQWTRDLERDLSAFAFVRVDAQGNLVVEVQADAFAEDPDAEVEANLQAVDASPIVQAFKDHCDAHGVAFSWTRSLTDFVGCLTFETQGYDG